MIKIALLILTCALSANSYADTYKWVDEKGVTHYTDQPPPPGATKVEQKKLTNSVIGTTMPYALQQTVKNFPVTVYVNDCGEVCNSARGLLNRRGIPFTEKNPENPKEQSELAALTRGSNAVPVLQVGRSVLRGFEEAQWNTALDEAGYPKTSVLLKQPAKAKPPASRDEKDAKSGAESAGAKAAEAAGAPTGPADIARTDAPQSPSPAETAPVAPASTAPVQQ